MPAPRRHADHVLSVITTDAPARSAVAASWRRSCAMHGLDPAARRPPRQLTGGELRLARQRIEPLLHAAQRNLDRLFQAIGGGGCCVLLADADGVPLERRGAARDDAYFQDCGLWTGMVWSEGTEGTNGIGTCLVEQRPVTIHRDQHFLTRNTALSCTGAPVFDHEANLAGVLDVSSCRDVGDGLLQLMALAVGDAARRIEAENFRAAFPQARIVMAPDTDATSPGWLAVDADDLVIGASRAARVALGMAPGRLQQQLPAADLIGGSPSPENLDRSEAATLNRALARVGGNVTAAAAALGISRATLHRKMKRYGLREPS